MRTPLWIPDPKNIDQSHLKQFLHWLYKKKQLEFLSYNELYTWSIKEPKCFWLYCAEYCAIQLSTPPTTILETHNKMQKTKWFTHAKLNFAHNLLWRRDNHTALIYQNEVGIQSTISYNTLYKKATGLARYLKALGMSPGDRVAAFCSNRIETVIAMLASACIGAIWSACSPEFSTNAVIDRFSQIEPVILFAVSDYQFQGKTKQLTKTIHTLEQALPTVKKTIIIDNEKQMASLNIDQPVDSDTDPFTQLPFDHPLYILYSSGTTGKPKCMVHGAGNTLLQHKKELMLHTDLHHTDTIFFYTTCSWMMWHWLISSLSVGATLVLYDGAPFYQGAGTLIDLIDQHHISIFGAGAKIYETWQKNNLSPIKSHQLKHLRVLLSTGSPLLKHTFEYLYQQVKKNVRVSSMSGGSDLIACFALGNPLLPVYAEELQCRGLGMAVEIFNDEGKSVIEKAGELVCTQPFPSMPLYFWNDPEGEKYQQAYFDIFPNIWTHGDFAKLTVHAGLIIYGRSDATLNPGGVRVGTADIYQQVLKVPEVIDCVAVSKKVDNEEMIILFVALAEKIILNESLIQHIKATVKNNTSPFHTPKFIYQVPEIPKTMNGKTMEIAVKNILEGKPVKNKEALANPKALTAFYQYR